MFLGGRIPSRTPILQAGSDNITAPDAAGTWEWRLKSDGTVQGWASNDGSTDDFGRWLNGAPLAAEWEARATFVSGVTAGGGLAVQGDFTGTFGSWITLDSDRAWGGDILKSPFQQSTMVMDVEFRRGGALTFPAVQISIT